MLTYKTIIVILCIIIDNLNNTTKKLVPPMSRFPRQVVPLIVLFSLAVVALIVSRQLLVPKSFGKYGHYRANAVSEIASQEMVYVGAETCGECHDDIYAKKSGSNHNGVACEVCHGPGAKHVEAPDEFTPDAPRERGLCPLCHGYNPSRPSGFPQILPELHNPGKACMSCHDPHDPTLPNAPSDCSACHREIANRKMVSHHATLECRACHTVPKDHWENPRYARAIKPRDNSTCARCHDRKADSPREIPRVDVVSHAERYKCWDCHYPHFPEANQ